MGGLVPYYAALFVGILIAVAGQLLLKTGADRSGDVVHQFLNLFTILGVGAYGGAAVLYILALRKIPLSLAYPTVSLSYAAVAYAAHYFWGERFGWGQIAGIALIWSGILMLHRT